MRWIAIPAITCVIFGGCSVKQNLLEAVNEGVIRIDDVGGNGNGTFDNSDLLEEIIALPEVEQIVFGSGDYLIGRTIHITGKDIVLTGQGNDLTSLVADGHPLLVVEGKQTRSIEFDDVIRKGDIFIILPEVEGVAEDDLLHVHSPVGMPETSGNGHTTEHSAMVHAISGDTIWFDEDVQLPFTESVTISFYRPQHFVMRDIQIRGVHSLYLLNMHHLTGADIENVLFQGAAEEFQGQFLVNPERGTSAIGAFGCHNVTVDSSIFRHIWYGLMAHNGCRKVLLTNSYAEFCRHISNCAIGTDGYRVINCTTYQCNGGFDSHETGLGTSFINCTELEPMSVSKFRGRRDTLINCSFDGDIELRIDKGIYHLASDTAEIAKMMDSCIIHGRTEISGGNARITNSRFEGSVHPHTISGYLAISRCTIDVSVSEDEYFAALTIGDRAAGGFSYTFEVNDIELIGPSDEDSAFMIGLYCPAKRGAAGYINNIRISRFREGMAIHGKSHRYAGQDGIQIDSIKVSNCQLGIKRQGDERVPIQIGPVTFTNNVRNMNNDLILELVE